MDKDYYKTLGIDRKASLPDMKKPIESLPGNTILISILEIKQLKQNLKKSRRPILS